MKWVYFFSNPTVLKLISSYGTMLAAIVAAVAAVQAMRQTDIGRDQANLAKMQTVLGQQQFSIAQQQADISKNYSELQLRAYVNIEISKIDIPDNEKRNVKIEFSLKNTGQTPAYDLSFSGSYASSNLIDWEDIKTNIYLYTLGNGQSSGTYIIDTDQTVERFFSNKIKPGFAIIKVAYSDIYHKERNDFFCSNVFPSVERQAGKISAYAVRDDPCYTPRPR